MNVYVGIPDRNVRRETLAWFKHDFQRNANVTDLVYIFVAGDHTASKYEYSGCDTRAIGQYQTRSKGSSLYFFLANRFSLVRQRNSPKNWK